MALSLTQEGTIPFKVPSIDSPCTTFYKVFGDISCGKPPIVILHGGPGGGHDYCLPFADLWPQYGIPVILYDQIGCGRSTHLQHKADDSSFWQEGLFVAELQNLLDFFKLQDDAGPGFHLLGQSWGGCLGSAFASTQPKALRRLVLAGAMASIELSIKSIRLLRQGLPEGAREALNDAEQRLDFSGKAYREGMKLFLQRHVCRTEPFPEDLVKTLNNLAEDKTVYGTMYGPSTIACIGTLVPWTYDTSHDLCTAPFFENIPKVRWITFSNGGHMCHLEAGGLRERVLKVVGDFLTAG
ncbi:hypothetical protein M409DRAFT_70728 [Zasmidium cellare ATCC 36951]|uniref:AB hydrolase-1 domain-containing protein n=1 Tax=Zasmidium cellare ATCC 36951 TaxID=1080233 RepID=A0A6A6C362_ZASCE|nr:uncharacterized protein M409DRAFT_70728 [Zasmidium cellare ATCC 36951]KAF2159826.1 hypothetical protein M409DRAFT_70728 [Zasmidium cellare ATCC 36951]